jgi:hypothetical protein
MHASRSDLSDLLKDGNGIAVLKSRFRLYFRDILVAAEIAFCFVLVFGCVLSLRGLQRALTLSLGFQAEHVATVAFDLGLAGYQPAQGRQFQQRVLDSVRTLPGMDSVASDERDNEHGPTVAVLPAGSRRRLRAMRAPPIPSVADK